jgi:subtilisin family serine protease
MVDAANNGIPVISMSLGGTLQLGGGKLNASNAAASVNAWRRVANYVNNKGTLVVAAAGNSSLDMNGTLFFVPADVPTVMAVSATGTSTAWSGDGHVPAFPFDPVDAAPGSDVLAFYSNYGAQVDVSAPGGDCGPAFPNDCDYRHLIASTYIFPDGASMGWAWFAGTSMATPHVSAVAAEVRALHPTWTPGAVRSWLKDNAEPIGPRQLFGQGLVNADLAVR